MILAIDDTPDNIHILDEILSDHYNLRFANNGPEGLEIANSTDNPPDIILLDIMMPEMDGFEVIEKLKAEPATREIPVIFLTSLTGTEDEEKGLNLGAVDYIRKPFIPKLVLARVKTHLALKEAHDLLAVQNEELKKAAHLKEDVERIARHDMKTPINSIIAIPDIILAGDIVAGDNLTDEQKEGLNLLKESGYQLLHMVNLSIDLYKIEQGDFRFQPTPVDLVPLANRILAELSNIIDDKGVRVSVGSANKLDDSFNVSGSETLLYSMLANIIKNAVEASPEKGIVSIAFFEEKDMGVMSVHNAGAIPKEIRARFGEKYTTFGKEQGTGLGAYSASLMAKTLGGAIKFETSDDSGTTIMASIPLSEIPGLPSAIDEKVSSPSIAPAEGTDLDDFSYLVVDDTANIRMIVREALRTTGATRIDVATNGRNATTCLERRPVDVVISDWNMPKMNGLELLSWIRNSTDLAETTFIMLTAEATKENVLIASQAGVNGYIVKPFTPGTLLAKLKQILL
jgi:CheY-like chemotaxis protein